MKVLFITSNRIGDAVLSTGLLNHLINTHKDIEITLACGPDAAPLFSFMPGLEEVISLRKLPNHMHWLRLWKKVRLKRWDIVVDLRSSLIAYFLISKKKYIYRKGNKLNHQVVDLTNFLNLDDVVNPVIWLSESLITKAKELIPPSVPVFAVGPTANWKGKQWSSEKFYEIIGRLTAHESVFEGYKVAVFGSLSERDSILPLLKKIPKDRLIDLVGRCDILSAASCLQQCRFFIGNDSGLMHISASTQTPTLGLFGPSREELYAPWGDHCSFVRTRDSYDSLLELRNSRHYRNSSLMESLSVDTVESAVIALWNRINSQSLSQSTSTFG